jgi:hypothetical protein
MPPLSAGCGGTSTPIEPPSFGGIFMAILTVNGVQMSVDQNQKLLPFLGIRFSSQA